MCRTAASDLCLPDDHSRVILTERPLRWDEYLDLDIPVLIAHTCGEWEDVGRALRQSGLSENRIVRLVEVSGAVKRVRVAEDGLQPVPEAAEWTLVLNWSHSEEGWRSRLPLWGKTYLVTRQRQQGEALIDRLRALGASAAAVPTIDFVPPDDESIIRDALHSLESFDWIILTSPNGVRHFFQRLLESEQDHRALGRVRFACIGPGTAKTLKKQGFQTDVLPESYVAEGLLEALEEEDMTGQKVLIPRAQEAREVLPETLAQRGAEVTVAPVYKTVHPAPDPSLSAHMQPPTRVLFTSSSTVKNWVALTGNRELPCFCIGPVTAATAREEGLEVLAEAPVHTIEGLLETVRKTDGQLCAQV